MTKYVVINTDGTLMQGDAKLTVEFMQGMVGGFFDALPTPPFGGAAFCRETPGPHPRNDVASTAMSRVLGSGQSLYGPVVFFGHADGNGEPTDISEQAAGYLEGLAKKA